ncbi:MAG: FMN-binding negative transcriptional regulator, partial [Steroidobacteraceae bacterium]
MYTKPEFAPSSREEIFNLIQRTTFATIVSAGPEGLVASHLAFLADPHRGKHGTLRSHLACANPHTALIAAGHMSIVMFNGPHGYISSSWYPASPVRDSAPTWNFAVVHCHGRPQTVDMPSTARQLSDLVEHLEHHRAGRWSLRELGPGGMERRLSKILGFEIPIERLEAKFKMGQDERLPDTEAAIRALSETDPTLADLMSRHNAHRRQ